MSSISPPPSSLSARLIEILRKIGLLGFIGFGGPQVHVVLFRRLFVFSKEPWLDPVTFADLFALSGSLPGPGSTQLLFSIALVRGGALAGWLAFFLWSLPGAFGMFLLAIAVKHIPSSLPPLVLALLTGLNAAAVGLIFFAAHKLTQMTAVDSTTRIVLFMSAAIGTCYTATWLFPVLTVGGGIVTLFFDLDHVQNVIVMCKAGAKRLCTLGRRQRFSSEEIELPIRENAQVSAPSDNAAQGTIPIALGKDGHDDDDSKSKSAHSTSGLPTSVTEVSTLHRRQVPRPEASLADPAPSPPETTQIITPTPINFRLTMTQSLLLVAALFAILITVLVLQATLLSPPRELRLFTNLFIAGTILFGGGPVVVPLLQGYIVTPGWVSTNDFLFGFAILQAFPGPNFDFAVFLGALSLPHNPVLGGVLGYIAIFFPGLILKFALLPAYRSFRDKRLTRSALRGLNSAASGLVWTSIFRLWKVGLLAANSQTKSLETSGYWAVIAGASFAASEWFSVQPPVVIAGGSMAGLLFGVAKGAP